MSGAEPDAAQVLAWDSAHVWHPYCAHDHVPPPEFVRCASGAYLELDDGRRIIDGNGSWWVSVLGHNHPSVVDAMRRQLDDMAHVSLAGLTHEPAARLAHRLVQLAPPGLNRVFYSDNGSTAVEFAIRAAFQFHQQNGAPERRRFITFDGAYHGDTLGAVSVGGVDTFHERFGPLLFGAIRVASPSAPRWYEDSVARLEATLNADGDTVAAVIVEPLIQGAAGMLMYPAGALRTIADACARHGVLLIADEVFVGFGRTGTMFACEQAGVTPDFLCLSKGLTGGAMPFAATLTTERLFDGFRGDRSRMLHYGHSYCGNPLGCAAAHGTLDAFESEGVLAGIPVRAALMDDGLRQIGGSDFVRTVRRTGLVGAVQIGEGSDYDRPVGWQVYAEALARGAYLRPLGNVVYFVPPLNVETSVLERLLGIADDAIRAVAARA